MVHAMAHRAPDAGAYEMQSAFNYLRKHMPGLDMRLAAARFEAPAAASASEGDRLLLDLSRAFDAVRCGLAGRPALLLQHRYVRCCCRPSSKASPILIVAAPRVRFATFQQHGI